MLLLLFLLSPVYSFIVGGCIGPKSVLERLLSPAEKVELRRFVHTHFDGDNAHQLLPLVNQYVLEKIGPVKWNQILPELVAYQSKHHECSIYAQLLPKHVYKSLLHVLIDQRQQLMGIIPIKMSMDKTAKLDFFRGRKKPFQHRFRTDTAADNERIDGRQEEEQEQHLADRGRTDSRGYQVHWSRKQKKERVAEKCKRRHLELLFISPGSKGKETGSRKKKSCRRFLMGNAGKFEDTNQNNFLWNLCDS